MRSCAAARRAAPIELRVAAARDRARGRRDRPARAPPRGPAAPAGRRDRDHRAPGRGRALSVQADELGRFVLDGLRAGVVRLHVAAARRADRDPLDDDLEAAVRPPGPRAGSRAAARAVRSTSRWACASAAVAKPLRDIVRASIAAVIGDGERGAVPRRPAVEGDRRVGRGRAWRPGRPCVLPLRERRLQVRRRARPRRPTSRSC